MDRKNKTDQFFREKLDQLEFPPSDQAWRVVQNSIHSKPVIPWVTYISIAASLALLLTLGYLFYPRQEQHIQTIGHVSSPAPLELTFIDVPAIALQDQSIKSVVTQKPKAVSTEKQQPTDRVQQPRKVINLASIEEIDLAREVIVREDQILENPEGKSAVTITYFTARSTGTIQEVQDTSKVNLFDKVKFFAKNVSPVELITDLRSAKQELIENGFKRN